MHRLLLHCARHFSRQLAFLLLVLSLAIAAGAAGVSVVGVETKASTATWSGVAGVASDASGIIYVALNNPATVYRFDPSSGTASTYIANATLINGLALNSLRDLLIDSSSNLYISDIGNSRILKWSLTSNALVTVYTGNAFSMTLDHSGNIWYGDANGQIWKIPSGSSSGSVLLTGVGGIWGMAFDTSNNLFVADTNGNRIIRYASPGNGAMSVPITLTGPRGLYFDANNNLYVAVKPTGQVLEYTAASSYSTSLPVAYDIADVLFITASPNGDLFVSDFGNGNLWRITQQGYGAFYQYQIGSGTPVTPATVILQVAAGTNIGSFVPVMLGGSGQDFALVSAANTCPTGAYSNLTNCRVNVMFAPTLPGQKFGGLQVVDSGGSNLLASIYLSGPGYAPLVSLTPGVISTSVGTGAACSSGTCGDGFTATQVQLNLPRDAVLDGSGNLYIADASDNRVRKVLASTQVISTAAGTGTACSSLPCGDGGAATSAQLSAPHGVAIDGVGNLYIAEAQGHRVRKVDPLSHLISTVAGTGSICSNPTAQCGDTGLATNAQLNTPTGVAVDVAGNLYIADSLDHRIRRVDAVTKLITTVAGSGLQCASSTSSCGDGGVATSAQLNQPNSVTVDGYGSLYIADSLDNRIREVNLSTRVILTAVGNGSPCTGAGACGDGGIATDAMLNNPASVDVDAAGNLYVADRASMRVRKVDSATRLIYTIAGDGVSCGAVITCNEGKAATTAALDSIDSVRVDRFGNFYVVLGDSNVIRRISASAAPLTFPSTLMNTASATQSVIFSNVGNDALSFSVSTDNSNFILGPTGSGICSTGLPAGASCSQSVYFQPQLINNSITGNLKFYDNLSSSPQAVALSGAGVATLTPQTITFPNPGNQNYGVTPITLTATASSGLAVSYLVTSGPATVNGSVLTITGAGSISVQATQAGNSTYAPALSVAQSFIVSPRSLTVTANNANKPYGQVYATGAGSSAFTSLGLVNGDLIDSVTITANGGTASNDPLGPYALFASVPIGAKFNAANYNITYNSGTLTVIAGTLTITASNASKVYGQTLSYGMPTTAFTVTGLASGDQVVSVVVNATSGGTAASSPVGNYPLTPSSATGTFNPLNYNINYANGTLQVVGYPLTITATDDTKPYGTARSYGANSTAFTSSGLLNSDAVSTVTITAGGGTAANAPATTYALSPSAAVGSGLSNYSITYVPGKLVVTPAPLIVTASNDTKTYGQTRNYGANSTAFTSSGLLLNETIGSVTLTPNGGTGVYVPVGNYSLTPSAATGGSFTASNYSITYVAGTLTVTPAPLTITALNDTKPYGQNRSYGASTTGFSANGLANGENIGTVLLTASGGLAGNAALGAYPLTPSGAAGGTFNPANYSITYHPGTLTVVAAPVTITANSDSKVYGQTRTYGANSAAFTYVGMASWDVITSVTISASNGGLPTAPATTYPLTPSLPIGTFNPQNYVFTFNPGILTVTQLPLTITATGDSKVYGQTRNYGAGSSAFTPTALANNESVTSVTITASGGTAANSPVGTYQLVPSQAVGGGTFLATNYAITYLPGTLTVSPTTLTITAANQTKTYGQSTAFGPGSTAFTSNGLVAGDVISSVTLTASSGGGVNAPVGRYTLTPSAPVGPAFLASNYLITYNSGTLTVTTAPLTITATSAVKTYGQTLTYGVVSSGFTATGLASNESIGTVTINANGGTAANAPLGSYTLTPSGATGGTFNAANYQINYVPGTLTVNPAALTVTASDATKYYGQTSTYGVMTTGYTVVGLVAGDTVGTVTITPSGGTAFNAPAGSYTLMPSAAAATAGGTFLATNYTVTYVGGTLTVKGPLLTITANNDIKNYGDTRTYGAGSTAFSSMGLVNGETIGSVTMTASGGTAANAPAGSYWLVPSSATGGSFNPANYTLQYVAGTLTVNKGISSTQLTTSAPTVLLNTSVTFTATVTPTTVGVPTGVVTFKDGTTSIGSVSLDATGVATLADSALTSGVHSITAVYAGDATFATSTSSAVAQTVQDFQFVVNGANVNGATQPVLTQSISKGQSATYQFQISPSPSMTFPNAITLTVSGLPAGATATITPTTIAAGSGTQTVTLVIQTSASAALRRPDTRAPGTGAPGGIALGLLVPAFGLLRLRRKDRRLRRMLLLALLLIALFALGMAGCGGGSTQGFYGSTTQTFNMQLVATSGSLQHFTTISITVK